MSVFRVFSCLGCVFFFVAFSQGASAQCITTVMKYCSNEQFSNPCSEPCNAVGNECGLWVDHDYNLVYSGVENAPTGMDQFATYPNPRWCGTVKKCKCLAHPLTGATCTRSFENYSDYWVSEMYATGYECP